MLPLVDNFEHGSSRNSGRVSGTGGMIRRSTGRVIGTEIRHLRLAGHVTGTATGKLAA